MRRLGQHPLSKIPHILHDLDLDSWAAVGVDATAELKGDVKLADEVELEQNSVTGISFMETNYQNAAATPASAAAGAAVGTSAFTQASTAVGHAAGTASGTAASVGLESSELAAAGAVVDNTGCGLSPKDPSKQQTETGFTQKKIALATAESASAVGAGIVETAAVAAAGAQKIALGSKDALKAASNVVGDSDEAELISTCK